MLKNILILSVVFFFTQANANLKPTNLKIAATTPSIDLKILHENCNDIKEIAKVAIDLRYLEASLPTIYKHADEMFPNKSDVTYKNLFKLIAKDAYQEVIYKQGINIKKEKQAFIDRNYMLCKAAYSQF